MSNSLLSISMITKETLMQLKNMLSFSANVNRQYDSQFKDNGKGKIGSVINIRKPLRYETTSGKALTVQDSEDQSVALTLDSQEHVGMQFSSKERTLNIEEFSDRYIKPAVTALANKIDYDGTALYQDIYNSVGTPESLPNSLQLALQAGQKLKEGGAPKKGAKAVMPPSLEVAFVNSGLSAFNDRGELSKQYKEGYMGRAAGFDWFCDQNMRTHTVGDLEGTPAVATTVSNQGATTIALDGSLGSVTDFFKKGDVFTIAGVYRLNPQTRQSTGALMQFVVTADTDSSGGSIASLPISPAIRTTGPYANCSKFPEDGDAVLTFGAAATHANKVSPSGLVYHRDAFALGMADLEAPDGGAEWARASDPDAGLSLRIVRQYDINNDNNICRVDVLYGWKTIYEELACRVHG